MPSRQNKDAKKLAKAIEKLIELKKAIADPKCISFINQVVHLAKAQPLAGEAPKTTQTILDILILAALLAKASIACVKKIEALNFDENRLFVREIVDNALSFNEQQLTQGEIQKRIEHLKSERMQLKEKDNRYVRIIERIFHASYKRGRKVIEFTRDEIEKTAKHFGIVLPKNIGDVVYSFRYRNSMPKAIQERAAPGNVWIIRGVGRSRYCFVELPESLAFIKPTEGMAETKIPDSTPGIIDRYAFNDEQSLLARLRYNRLIDIFTGVACYSLQNHLRTTVSDIGQIETDEVYIGIDRQGNHFLFPIQAKGGKDKLNIVQIEQDFALGRAKFPLLICRPIAAQFKENDLIVLIGFEDSAKGPKRTIEKQYRLVPHEDITEEDLQKYQIKG